MILKIGIENKFEGRSLAWALDYPGCFHYGNDASEAIVKMPVVFLEYVDWIKKNNNGVSWVDPGDFDVRVVESWDCYPIDENLQPAEKGKYVQSWFFHDWQPLTQTEIRQIAKLIEWGKNDLIKLVTPIPADKMDREYGGEKWSIRGIIAHVATSQWWLLDRIDLADCPRNLLSADPFERYRETNLLMNRALEKMAGLQRVTGKEGEFWSPRKVIRRAVWHQIDHLAHIRRLMEIA